ncbi:proteasome subunit beta [Halobaculum sp. CBA1158]|uniref:proteasome subunit beta n=1 Tax=Halobaculum sp. CBA1158 TaxID=2904243 RepID=UPI001F23D87A|nr:proteasome subunit beta [Halobaculum sp. CBA1158]UIO98781.1 proteasome subunit beta [Halobaculum sp. CBA1158]
MDGTTDGELSLGTTIVGIVADGGTEADSTGHPNEATDTTGRANEAADAAGTADESAGAVVLASDRRASLGGMVASKRAEKVYPVGDAAALAFTGSVSGAQALVSDLNAERRLYELRRGRRMSTTALAGYAATEMRRQQYGVQHLLGGVDDDGARLFAFDAAGSTLEQPYAADGSGGQVAYGTLENGYEEGIGVGEAERLAARAVAAASERDTASGNGLQLVTVTADGVESGVYDDPAAVAA